MPALSPTMKKGKILQWNKKPGDKLAPGDVLAEVETDKASVGFEMQDDAYLAKILVQAGEREVGIGEIIAITVDDAADVAKFADYKLDGAGAAPAQPAPKPAAAQPQPAAASPPPPTQPQQSAPQPQAAAPPTSDRIAASPFAKKTAQEAGVNLGGVKGSGPGGRILEQDVRAAASAPKPATAAAPAPRAGKSAPPPENPYVEIPLTSVRAVIAERLTEAKRSVPHFYLTIDIVMDELLKAREALNKSAKIKLSVTDILVKACSNACLDVPEVNSQFHGTAIRKYKNVDVAVAVSYDAGLITPIVYSANTKGLNQIAHNTKDLIDRARKSQLQPHEFIGGTFTISNLGMFGISQFSAIINPPQSCILAVSKTEKKLLFDEKNPEKPKVANVMSVTLSCDHRVVDGATGAQWLQKLKNYLEHPITLLL